MDRGEPKMLEEEFERCKREFYAIQSEMNLLLSEGRAATTEGRRNGPGLPLQRDQDRSAGTQNDVGSKRDQLRGISSIAVGIGESPAGFDPHISAVRPTKLLKRLHERGHAPLRFRILRGEIH